MMPCLALTFVSLIVVSIGQGDASTEDACAPSYPIMEFSEKSGAWLDIFLDIKVACVGKVKRWEFYASNPGVFYASIWRKTDGAVTLVGKNRIEADAIGRADITIAEDQQITVQAGDFIGIHYPKRVSPGVVPYEFSGENLCCGFVDSDLSYYIATGAYHDDNLAIGTTVTKAVSNDKRMVALKAIVEAACIPSSYPIIGLTKNPGNLLNVFLDIVPCVGKVKRWEFYASSTGAFYASIWRKNDGSVTLVGKNRIEVDAIGQADKTIAEDQQITVQAGDVIGIHYPNEASQGVVQYENAGPDLCCGFVDSDLSDFLNIRIYDDELAIGTAVPTVLKEFKRMVALKAIVG